MVIITEAETPFLKMIIDNMLEIPEGEYEIASTGKTKRVKKGTFICKYHTTVGAWMEYCYLTGQAMPEAPSWGWIADHPMVNISWFDARRFCNWLSFVTGEDYSLPSSSIWEIAAAGREKSIYPWGNEWDTSKCHRASNMTAPVTAYPQGDSWMGCRQMAGNVWDMTRTEYKSNR